MGTWLVAKKADNGSDKLIFEGKPVGYIFIVF